MSILLLNILKDLKINRTLLRYRPRVSRASQSHDCMLLGALITLLSINVCFIKQRDIPHALQAANLF
ncbi:hypothetical protein HZI65_04605 [Haemophilus haemolyticus]|uniref:Uncharacterized protein n=1 Tax=Haemophilus haemolyticus TaxID=726 RepID=A0A502JW80_HAEHA|nr:hypothetical protein [Haemophilus haemolyticus]MBS6021519.1 hypothetical protein [Haemophilus haemolyticus]NYA25319.1 hypothetical protein [Haemophilus haemolyticus]TPH00047.1 hypothetical protein EUX55_04640 [Haemophilus haemolyticus]